MSGLPFRFLLLVAAAAMTGVTAFTVTPGSMPPTPENASPEFERATGASDVESLKVDFVPWRGPIENVTLRDRQERSEATRVVPPEVKTATIAFGGDILIHASIRRVSAIGADTFDFRPLFAGIRPTVAGADLALCHLEVPLTSVNTDLSTYPLFNAPHEVADGIAYAGFDGCSTASNHSIDQGPDGLIDTLDILDSAGVGHAGTARSPEEAATATIYQVGELKVAHIAATYWLNGLGTPEGKEWMAQLIDLDAILDMAGQARWNGADLVVVSIHCCTEYRTEPTAEQVEIFENLSRSPWVDLVVGHHSHVVGPIDKIDGEFVAYGLGNLLSGQRQFVNTMDGALAIATAQWSDGKWRIAKLEVVPTTINRNTMAIEPAPDGSTSFARTMAALNAYGADVGVYQPAGSAWLGEVGGPTAR